MVRRYPKFYYVLVNHNIRKNSLQEAKKVKNLLKKKQINLKIISNKKKIEKNIQGEARNIRYEILSNFCLKNNIRSLITAHNLEDQVETFLIRLSRGSGLRGLSAMRPKSKLNSKINLYRPLLDTKKEFLIKISKKTFGNFIKDPSKITTIIAPENMSAFNLGPYVEHNTRAEEVDMEEVTAS